MEKGIEYSPQKQETYSGLYFDMTIKDQIAYVQFKISDMNITAAKQMVAERVAYMKPISYPCLIDLSNLISADDETMRFMAGEGGAELITCAAFLVKNEINGLTYDTFQQLKPLVPIKAFRHTDKEEAVNWLKYMANIN